MALPSLSCEYNFPERPLIHGKDTHQHPEFSLRLSTATFQAVETDRKGQTKNRIYLL